MIGLSPRQVDDMTLWELQACREGYQAANGGEEAMPIMDDERARELGIEGF